MFDDWEMWISHIKLSLSTNLNENSYKISFESFIKFQSLLLFRNILIGFYDSNLLDLIYGGLSLNVVHVCVRVQI